MHDLTSRVVDTCSSPHARLRPVPIGSVRMEDDFWAPRLRQLRAVTLPSQYDILEETGRVDNFRRAAGKVRQDFRGIYFNDSDVYKWIEGCAFSLAAERDAHVEALAERVIGEIAGAQRDDGYLNTYYTFERADQRWTNLKDMHELYCAGHLVHAAVAYRRATGRRELLDVALRFADHIGDTFGPDNRPGTPGHPQLEMALVELYRETGERRYLDLAQFFLDQRGHGVIGGSPYHQDHRPFREFADVVGHAVRCLYLACGATDLYMETGEPALRDALERVWTNMTQRRMYATGGVGARHAGEAFGGDFELPNESAYAETCAAIANAIWNWRLLLATGDVRYADVMERAIYNGALSGISLDGRHYFYVNPLASRGRHRRQRWFDCACCPTNIVRLIGAIPGYLYTTSEEGVWLHTYASNSADVVVAGENVRLVQRTTYPWEGEVGVQVWLDRPTEFSLFLRIPDWTGEAKVAIEGASAGLGKALGGVATGGPTVNGAGVSIRVEPDGFFRVRRTWKNGDWLTLSLAMGPEIWTGHPRVEASAGRAFVRRGPIVYCFEGADNPDVDVWSARLSPPDRQSAHVHVASDLLGGVATLDLDGAASEVARWAEALYLPLRDVLRTQQGARLRAIPYYAWANREESPMAVWLGHGA